jgi:transposase
LLYDAAFCAEALRLASEHRSTQATACTLTISSRLLYKWQQAAQTPAAAEEGANLDPATAAVLRHLRATNRR